MSLQDCANGWHQNEGDDVCVRCGLDLNPPRRPEMDIESTVTIAPEDADGVGRLLLALAEASREGHLQTVGTTNAFEMLSYTELNDVGNALLALGNDTDAIIAPADEWEDMKRSAEATPTPKEPVFKTARTVADVEDMPSYVREHFEEQDRITAAYEEEAHEETDLDEIPEVYISMIEGDLTVGWNFRIVSEAGEVTKFYETLNEGVRDHSGAIFYFVEPEPDRFYVRLMFDDGETIFHVTESTRSMYDEGKLSYRVWDRSAGRFVDGTFRESSSAHAWKRFMMQAEEALKEEVVL
jgi:hypothetical protein